MQTANPESEWFGFRRVRPGEKARLVGDVFASVADRYDLMNDLMSGGLHRLWKDQLLNHIRPRAKQTLLDVAGGTGDIALRCLQQTGHQAKVIVCDINAAMLRKGKARLLDKGISKNIDWVVGDAEALPLSSRSVDLYSISFGLRNVSRIDDALKEAFRVLKPGGRFFCLEFSSGVKASLKPIYDRYCQVILPQLGKWVARDEHAYRYLAESIRQFPKQEELGKRVQKAEFEHVRWTNLSGGIAVIHEGWKL